MLGLAGSGELKYNGINFDGASRVSVSCEPVRDEAEFTVLYQKYTITVQSVIARTGVTANGAGTDPDLETIRAALSEDGRELIFRQKGFGQDLIVNGQGPIKDLCMGPKPQVLEWKPIGDYNACEITWSVTTCVPECNDRDPRRTGVMAFNYEVTWEINESGDTTRTIAGYLKIVQVRLSNKKLLDSADDYRLNLISLPPSKSINCQRTKAASISRSPTPKSPARTRIPPM